MVWARVLLVSSRCWAINARTKASSSGSVSLSRSTICRLQHRVNSPFSSMTYAIPPLMPARQSLSEIVMHIAFESQAQSFRYERAKTLAGGTREANFNRAVGQTRSAVAPGDFTAENRPDGTVGVRDRQL